MSSLRFKAHYLVVSIIIILLATPILPVVSAEGNVEIYGFDKGVSWKNVVPLKKITLVNFDETSYIDDYAFLACVPTSVFYDSGNKIFSHPLLFYQDYYSVEERKENSLNARQGLDYFMEDWMGYCNGKLDKMILINVPESKVKQWSARNISAITGTTPYEIAAKIALHDWAYADDAVIAVIDDVAENYSTTKGEIKGTFVSGKEVKTEHFEVEQTNSLNPTYYEFTVPEGYKHIRADVWWDCMIAGGFIAIPPGDPDIQLFCQRGNEWMQAAAVAKWNILEGVVEHAETYVYNNGVWRIGITDIPTEDIPQIDLFGGLLSIQGSIWKILRGLRKSVTYNVDVTMHPGMEIEIPDSPPFGCRNAEFILEWGNANVNLGFSLIGPAGEEIASVANESSNGMQRLHIERLGECLPKENYSLCIFAIDTQPAESVDFTITYSWHQNVSRKEGEYLASASEGAILASVVNAPLLYVSPSKIPSDTSKALRTLGVKNVYVIDIGNHLSKSTHKKLRKVVDIKEMYTDYKETYGAIRSITKKSDIIFSTIDPWTYWYSEELRPAGEFEGALFIGPAAYIAAHHGSPLLLVDNHPELSSALVWHNEFWRRHVDQRLEFRPTVAEMHLTGKRVYTFLSNHNFDEEGMETMITIADQYDIGISWDRVFAGKATPGRICGSPVDASYWISRNIFYPALIFQNPALDSKGVMLINGSVSTRRAIGVIGKPFANTLVIKRPSQEENFKYPVLCSFVTHKYRFNERGSSYYGSIYQCADGLTPGKDFTFNPIDQGLGKKYSGIEGAIFPDMSESEVVPVYLTRGGYDVAFSTALEPVAHNLNNGVILWIHASHGLHLDGGSTLFWEPDVGFSSYDPLSKIVKVFAGAVKDENPWRGYEWYMGSTEEPDTMSMDIIGTFPFTNLKFPLRTGLDWSLAREPVKEFLNRVIPFFAPFEVDDRYDGVVGSFYFSRYQYVDKNATDIDALLGNIHSAGFITSICQTSNTYFHLSLIRHGSVFQIQDPWPTSWYGTVWRQSIPRDIALGDTIGEAYVKGISHVGILYTTEPPQWWWDNMENVVLFGDPDLRVWVPNTEYSSNNYWEKDEVQPLQYGEFDVDGHMLYGSTHHPHEKKPFPTLVFSFIGIVLVVIIFVAVAMKHKKKDWFR